MNQSGIRPVGEQVLIEPDPVEETTESGIITMTDTERDRLELGQTEGMVLQIAEKLGETCEFRAGDRVVFRKYSGLLLDGNDFKRYRLIEKRDVVGVFEETQND
jgi:chaperonin GroES